MQDYTKSDFYTDASLVADPHGYFAFLRNVGAISPTGRAGTLAVTGYDEAIHIMLDTEHFSNVNAVTGPLVALPFKPLDDDISEQVSASRATWRADDLIATTEGERHAALRSLLSRLFTPTRLKALEPTLISTAGALIDEFIEERTFNAVKQYGRPFTTFVIADLLGVPPEGRQEFREYLQDTVPAEIGVDALGGEASGIAKIGGRIYEYLAERRQSPRDDILTDLALARYPDGSEPSLQDLTALGAFLFGAGQDTTSHLIANGLRLLATRSELQNQLRAGPALIPKFVEELLRFDGSVKGESRLCVKTTTVGGVEIKAGTVLLIALMGANRDARRFDEPNVFKLDRPKAKEHLAFGRGPHTCIGAPLARAEARVTFERLLARLGNIRLVPAEHGDAGEEHFTYEATYILRALKGLYLRFEPI